MNKAIIKTMSKPVILTGLRANSDFHIGNYLGSILPMIDLQKKHVGDYQVQMFIPDLHSFTTPIDHSKLQAQILTNLKVFVAAGLDIENKDTYIYRQSYITAHSEMAWILDCFTYFGEASRMIEFKDKSTKFGTDTVSVGQFNYPVLMAGDILLYGATYVPLGDDQKQHLELTRDLAIRLNNKFERELFVVPVEWKKQVTFMGKAESIRIRSLRNPEKKMSKSVEDPAGTIMMTDAPEAAAKKIMGATTDSLASIQFDLKTRPGISNLLQIGALLSGQEVAEYSKKWLGQTQYGPLKAEVAGLVKDFLSEFQIAFSKVTNEQIQAKLEQDEAAMREVANATLLKVQKAVGLRPAKEQKPKGARASSFAKPAAIEFQDFSKLDIRMGVVESAEQAKGSDKLIVLKVNTGDRIRTIVTGMRAFYEPAHFVGKTVPILCNLKPRVMMGIASEGMLMAVEGTHGPVLLAPEADVSAGAPIE